MKFLLFLLAFPSIGYGLEYEVNASIAFPQDSQYNETGTFTGRIGTDHWYGFASYVKHKQVRLTQSMGEFKGYSYGAGYRNTVGKWSGFAEVGVQTLKHSTRPVIAKEVLYHVFLPDFGVPPFRPDGNFPLLEYSYKSDPAIMFRIGAQYEIASNVKLELAYQNSKPKERSMIWNPIFNGGPVKPLDACGCLWMGSDKIDLDTITLGISYSWGDK